MTYDEALAWLRGERSTINTTNGNSPGEASERAYRQDAAATEQAYWIVKASQEGLTGKARKTYSAVEWVLMGLFIAMVVMAASLYLSTL